MKTALITGITGQDGAYLARLLLQKDYKVYGTVRRVSVDTKERLRYLGVENDIEFLSMEMGEYENVMSVVDKVRPDEIYNLAAQSFVGGSFSQPLYTCDITGLGVLRMLESIRYLNKSVKFYQASSSEMFGKVRETPQNELTPFHPRSPYAVAKAMAHHATVNYRESYNIFGVCGILFNHESPLRGLEFVSRKITNQVSQIYYGMRDQLVLGNLDAQRDWGYADDYVRAMYLMMQQNQPDDYVVATGQTHTIKEFVEQAFSYIDISIEWAQQLGRGTIGGYDRKTGKMLVTSSEEFYRPAEVDLLIGDCSKAKKKLGWEPQVGLDELVKMMMSYDLQRIMEAKNKGKEVLL